MKKIVRMPTAALLFMFYLIPAFTVIGCANTSRSGPVLEKITILHCNDTHGQLLPFRNAMTNWTGGVSRRTSFIKDQRRLSPGLLLLQAGDILTGSVYSTVYRGMLDMEFMRGYGQTATAVGNHEFDYGLSNALALQAAGGFPFLSANILYRDSGQPVFTPYIVTNIRTARVVIAGVSTSDPGVYNRDALKPLTLLREEAALSNLFYRENILKKDDLVILLSHCGVEMDTRLAVLFPEIDVIIGGHSHTRLEQPLRSGNALIFQAGQWGESMGVLTVFSLAGAVESNSYRLADIDGNVIPDAQVEERLEAARKDMDVRLGEFLCESRTFWDVSQVRYGASPLGAYLADIMAVTGAADLGIMNAGGVRANLPAGRLKLSDLLSVLPFDNTLIILDMKGDQVLKAVTRGVQAAGKGGFLYYSDGFKVTASTNGGKISVQAEYKGRPVGPNDRFRVCVSDFLYSGGDGYTEFQDSRLIENTYLSLRDSVAAYLRGAGVIDAAQVADFPRLVIK